MKPPKTPAFFSKMSIARMGMLLIGTFIFLEICFCGALYSQIYQAEQEARREEHFKEIVQKTHGLEAMAWEAVEALKSYARTRDKADSQAFDAKSKEIMDTLHWLSVQLKGQKSCLRSLKKLDETMNTAVTTMSNARNMFDKTSNMQEALQLLAQTNNNFTTPFRELLSNQAALVRQEEKVVSSIPTEQRRLRRLIQTILAAGILANIVFAVLLFRFFTKTITSRLAVMVDNTVRFKTAKPLNASLSGSDEIARLDHSFHDMAQSVLEAQQMRQTFVAMISHDLRTPLTNVQAFLSLLTEGILGEIPKMAQTEAVKTEQNVARLIRLINDLLVLEKMEAGKMQMNMKVVYLENIIEKSIDAIAEFAKNHDVTLEYEESNAEVNADPDRLIQVLINLASNAVKFSPKGGTVRIKTIETENSVEVQVIDQGRGIPAAYKEAVFEKYKQVKSEDGSKKGGTGLGLPICKMIIEQLGGSIGVESEEGKGSTFWFKLPALSADGSTAQPLSK